MQSRKNNLTSAAYLNRQIITLLSTLGVTDDAFLNLLEENIEALFKMLLDEETAISKIEQYLRDMKVILRAKYSKIPDYRNLQQRKSKAVTLFEGTCTQRGENMFGTILKEAPQRDSSL